MHIKRIENSIFPSITTLTFPFALSLSLWTFCLLWNSSFNDAAISLLLQNDFNFSLYHANNYMFVIWFFTLLRTCGVLYCIVFYSPGTQEIKRTRETPILSSPTTTPTNVVSACSGAKSRIEWVVNHWFSDSVIRSLKAVRMWKVISVRTTYIDIPEWHAIKRHKICVEKRKKTATEREIVFTFEWWYT